MADGIEAGDRHRKGEGEGTDMLTMLVGTGTGVKTVSASEGRADGDGRLGYLQKHEQGNSGTYWTWMPGGALEPQGGGDREMRALRRRESRFDFRAQEEAIAHVAREWTRHREAGKGERHPPVPEGARPGG